MSDSFTACESFSAIESAITSGHYVRWEGPWSDGFVVAVKRPEWLVLTTLGPSLLFEAGFDQSIVSGCKFKASKWHVQQRH